jgi:hypothetical protein
MDEDAFRAFLKRGGRSPSAIDRCVRYVRGFAQYLQDEQIGKDPDTAEARDLEAFVAWLEDKPKGSAKTHLWALRYYYDHRSNEEMGTLASDLRSQRIRRRPFALAGFRGVNPDFAERLARVGVKNVEQMRKSGKTPGDREELSASTRVPLKAIEEFVKLSDLARLGGVKGIRARLYYDAGVDTLEKLAAWDAKELRSMLLEFVERTGFDGIAPLPKEAANAVATARRLPRVIEF